MKRTITLTESDLHRIVKESVKTIMNEHFLDDIRTKLAYAKNVIKDNLPPIGMKEPRTTIDSIKFNIERMEDMIRNKQECSSRFLHQYNVWMETAKEDGYIKYYKKMKQLYNQMVKLGLCNNKNWAKPKSMNDIYNDLENRIKKRGGYFHG